MKKILAAIVKYKLDKNNLTLLIQKINTEINTQNTPYPNAFKDKMSGLVKELQDIFSVHDDECIIDTLKEMEHLIVNYLSQSSAMQTNDCILN
jgi:hypothetical protein